MTQTEMTFVKATQTRRLLALLKERGKFGVTTSDCYEMGIWRGASRINDLRKQGHDIRTVEVRPVARYVYYPELETPDVS
jgi:hypothetical protein